MLTNNRRSTSAHFAYERKALSRISDSLTNHTFPTKNNCVIAEIDMQLISNYKPSTPPAPQQSSPSNSLCRLRPSERNHQLWVQKPEKIAAWTVEKRTPIGVMRAWSVAERKEGTYSEHSEKHVSSYALYPSWLLAKLGISQGLLIQARCTDGWQYTIQPFNAVPDDSLIFTFCANGNIDAVRTLLSSGKASLRDRSSRGYTPLFVRTPTLRFGHLLRRDSMPRSLSIFIW